MVEKSKHSHEQESSLFTKDQLFVTCIQYLHTCIEIPPPFVAEWCSSWWNAYCKLEPERYLTPLGHLTSPPTLPTYLTSPYPCPFIARHPSPFPLPSSFSNSIQSQHTLNHRNPKLHLLSHTTKQISKNAISMYIYTFLPADVYPAWSLLPPL